MRILVNISGIPGWDEATAAELNEEISTLLRGLYDDSCDDDEAYMHDEADSIILGRDDKDAVITEAEQWNDRLIRDVETAIANMKQKKAETGSWAVDNSTTYELKKAAMALDNDFYAYADYAVAKPVDVSPEYPPVYLETTLHDSERDYIKSHPEQFAVVEIYAK